MQAYTRVAFLLIAIILLLAGAECNSIAKNLAGPPSEFASNAIPNPLAAAIQESSAFLTAAATPSANSLVDSESVVTIAVDSTTFFSFSVFTQHSTSYSLKLVDPKGNPVSNLMQDAVTQTLEFGAEVLKTVTYGIQNPIVGEYTLYIYYSNGFISFKHANPRNASVPFLKDFVNEDEIEIDAVVLVYNESPVQLLSHISTYKSIVGSKISVISQVFNSSVSSFNRFAVPLSRPAPLKMNEVFVSDSIQVELSMAHPDGLISDISMTNEDIEGFTMEDGMYAATFRPLTPGIYSARVKFSAVLNDKSGATVVRTTQQIIAVTHNDIQLTGNAVAKAQAETDLVDIYLEVSMNTFESVLLRPYAQVWGTSSNGSLVPACWIATIAAPTLIEGKRYVAMQLNTKWLSLAEVKAPFYLREVSLQDVETYLVVSTTDSIPLTIQNAEHIQYKKSSEITITEEMLFGVRPSHLKPEVAAANGVTGKLILVHGYCAPSNPWYDYASDWTDADYVEFVLCADSNSKFAQKIDTFAKNKGYTSYSLAGYSQGGMAITELRTKFWSGADIPTKGKLLQSVVTPYKGQSLAGTTANLGKIFGVGCGSVYDLTLDGANLWSKTIPSSIRPDVSYYYVHYADKGFGTRYCNAALNTQLDKPNDGVTEVSKASFEGANDMGVTVGECHTKDMKYPPAYANNQRNQAINKAAARS